MLLSVRRLVVTIGVVCACVLGVGVSSAFAENRPGWEVFGRMGPTVLAPGSEGELALYLYNVGAASEAEGPTVVDTMPAGLEAVVSSLSPECSGTTEVVTCTHGPLPPAGAPEIIGIPVRAMAGASGEALDRVMVSGGGALASTPATVPVRFGRRRRGWGLQRPICGYRMLMGRGYAGGFPSL